jgi:putative endonuclease
MADSRKSPHPGNPRQSLGRRGEALAADYLQERSYQILERNYRSPFGEIDLIARQWVSDQTNTGPVLVFVEVKTRSSEAYGFPEESVTLTKQAHLIQSAQAYLQSHLDQEGNWRIDVIAVRLDRSGGPPEIKHFENAVH